MNAVVTATTNEQLTGSDTCAITYTQAFGMQIQNQSLNFGALNYSDNSLTTQGGPQVATLVNIANTPITSVTGVATDFSSDATGSPIAASALHAGVASMDNTVPTTVSGAIANGGVSDVAWHVVIPASSADFTLNGNYASQSTLTAYA